MDGERNGIAQICLQHEAFKDQQQLGQWM